MRAALFLCLAGAAGCVRTYHPMSGLHRPFIVDVQAPNFDDTAITVHCVPGGHLSKGQARNLCTHVSALFENQGAKVTTVSTKHRNPDPAFAEPATLAVEEVGEAPKTSLILELSARKLHEANYPVTWLACFASFTIITGVSEVTFAQDVRIRDENGFLLVNESMQGRMLQRFGVVNWFGNTMMNLAFRNKKNRISGDGIQRDLSSDLYGQLSQMMYNAKIHSNVLAEAGTGR